MLGPRKHSTRRAGSCFENRADNLSTYGAIFHLEYEGSPTLTCVFIDKETDHSRGRETQSASQSAGCHAFATPKRTICFPIKPCSDRESMFLSRKFAELPIEYDRLTTR
jgi:hypothetical protein